MANTTTANPFEENGQSNQWVKWLLTHARNIITKESWTKGRLSRGEYWISILVLGTMSSLVSLILSQFGFIGMWLGAMISIISWVRGIGMVIRRSHDLNQNGWYYFKPLLITLGVILWVALSWVMLGKLLTNNMINWILWIIVLIWMIALIIWMFIVMIKSLFYKGTSWENTYGADRLPSQPTWNWMYWGIGIALAILSMIFDSFNPSQQVQNGKIEQMIQQRMWSSITMPSDDMMNQIDIDPTQSLDQQINTAIQAEDTQAITETTTAIGN